MAKKTKNVKVTEDELRQIEAAGIQTEGIEADVPDTPDAPGTPEIPEAPEVPTYTIRADSLFGFRCMVAIRNLASGMLPRDEYNEIARKLREFDLYEELHRG